MSRCSWFEIGQATTNGIDENHKTLERFESAQATTDDSDEKRSNDSPPSCFCKKL